MSEAAGELTPEQSVERFVRMLDVRAAGDDVFVSESEHEQEGHHRLFGGLVLAQAAIAAGRTVDDASMHSLHAYFLRGGRFDVPIEYHVERVRDGRTFKARRVLVRQGDEAICDVTTSFAHQEDGIAHQDPMPEAPAPETLPDAHEWFKDQEEGHDWSLGPIEWRLCERPDYVAKPGERALVLEWARMRAPAPARPRAARRGDGIRERRRLVLRDRTPLWRRRHGVARVGQPRPRVLAAPPDLLGRLAAHDD